MEQDIVYINFAIVSPGSLQKGKNGGYVSFQTCSRKNTEPAFIFFLSKVCLEHILQEYILKGLLDNI